MPSLSNVLDTGFRLLLALAAFILVVPVFSLGLGALILVSRFRERREKREKREKPEAPKC